MDYLKTLYLFVGLMLVVFLVDYYLINKRKLKLINNKGKNKKGKNKKVKPIGELDYLIIKFKLKEKKLNKERVIFWIAIINSFIIAFVSSIIMLLDIPMVFQLLVAFVLLFSLIYSLYEIYGRYLRKLEEKK